MPEVGDVDPVRRIDQCLTRRENRGGERCFVIGQDPTERLLERLLPSEHIAEVYETRLGKPTAGTKQVRGGADSREAQSPKQVGLAITLLRWCRP
jgi:hypothetical protein